MVGGQAGVVGSEPFSGLGFLVVGQEAGLVDVVVEFPIDNGGGEDGYETDEEEDAELEGQCWWQRSGGFTYICHERRVPEGMCPSPKDRAEPSIVASPLVPYHAAMRSGCSLRRYH